MSIRIYHGYRVGNTTLADLDAFLAAVQAHVAPVRDHLDARLYAETIASIVDGHTARPEHGHTLKQAALAVFQAETEGAPVGTVWNHPHSFDLDYAINPAGDGHLYALVHCQRSDYHDAFAQIPGVTHHPYQTTTGRPEGTTESEWEQRRTDWQWLIQARRVSEVMNRWSYRPDPAPDLAHVTNDEVILSNLPTREERARSLAESAALSEHFAGADHTVPRFESIRAVIASPAVAERAAQIAADLPDITIADLAS